MICEREAPYGDAWGHAFEADPTCEWCERSLIGRFGGMPPAECDSCEDSFRREFEASGGAIEISLGDAA